MVHPCKRFGSFLQSAVFCMLGILIGCGWAILGRYLGKLILGKELIDLSEKVLVKEHYDQYQKCLVLLSIFEMIMLFFHGWMRVVNPKLFGFAFPLFLAVHFAFLDSLTIGSLETLRAYVQPFYLGIAISLLCNLLILPEFGSTYLGTSTLNALNQLHVTLDSSVQFFVTFSGSLKDSDGDQKEHSSYTKKAPLLKYLLAQQKQWKRNLVQCNAVLRECLYEVSYSYLSPTELKYFLHTLNDMTKYLIAIINGCQLEFSILGNFLQVSEKINRIYEPNTAQHDTRDYEQLVTMLSKIKGPTINLHKRLSETIYYIKLGICDAFDADVSKCCLSSVFPDNKSTDSTINIEDFDFQKQNQELAKAIVEFDATWREALQDLSTGENKQHIQNLLLPRDEIFLLSLFILNFKEVANSIIKLNKNTELLVELKKQRKNNKNNWFSGKTIWISFLTSKDLFMSWLTKPKDDTGQVSEMQHLQGNQNADIGDLLMPSYSSQRHRRNSSVSANQSTYQELTSSGKHKTAGHTVQGIDYYVSLLLFHILKFTHNYRHHLIFSIQHVAALMLASFPMFIPESRLWYIDIRGTWIGFVCILVLEPSIGDTFFVFFLRGVGIIYGATFGYISYVAAYHQRYVVVEVIVCTVASIPGYYYFLCTPYVKGAIIGLVSLYIVILATAIPSSIGGSIAVNYGKRCLALLYGGLLGLISNLVVFPVHAKEELAAELSFVCDCCGRMQLLYSTAIEGEQSLATMSPKNYNAFLDTIAQCKKSLARAEAFNGEAAKEFSFKGNFKAKSKLYAEMIFLLNEIVSRMENIVFLRTQYGSEIIEELNFIAHPYRRQVAASINNTMIAIREALHNKTPLPQYLPSARNAQKRLITVIRDYLKTNVLLESSESDNNNDTDSETDVLQFNAAHPSFGKLKHDKFILKDKLLSWCATTAALEEIIEYIEELVELSRILVGVSQFKYGFLSRSIGYEEKLLEAKLNIEHKKLTKLTEKENISISKSQTSIEQQREEKQLHKRTGDAPSAQDDNISLSSSESVDSNPSLDDDAVADRQVPVEYTRPEEDLEPIPTYQSKYAHRDANDLLRTKSIDSFRQTSRNFITRIYSIKPSTSKEDEQRGTESEEKDDIEELPLSLRRIMLKKYISRNKKR